MVRIPPARLATSITVRPALPRSKMRPTVAPANAVSIASPTSLVCCPYRATAVRLSTNRTVGTSICYRCEDDRGANLGRRVPNDPGTQKLLIGRLGAVLTQMPHHVLYVDNRIVDQEREVRADRAAELHVQPGRAPLHGRRREAAPDRGRADQTRTEIDIDLKLI